MKRRWRHTALLLALCCLVRLDGADAGAGAVSAAALPALTEPPEITAACAALYEMESGRLVCQKNGDQRAGMASTTKVMTALVALERESLDAAVDVPDCAVGVEGSSIYLARGERLSLSDLLYGLMLTSGNDAAVTIACHIAGSEAEFAGLMNERAAALGCTGTHFVNANGLPDENHYTTAKELARIAAEAMKNEAFRTIVGTDYHQTDTGGRNRTFKNKNKILWQYDGGNGVKTGFTKAAGRCLVFSAERGGMTLVGAVLNAPDMWNDAMALLDAGFAALERRTLVSAAQPLTKISVSGGEKRELAVYPKCDILFPVARDGRDEVRWTLTMADSLEAPVQAGTEAGKLTLLVGGVPVHVEPLLVTETVHRADLLYYIRMLLAAA